MMSDDKQDAPTLIDARIYEPGDYPPERGEGVRAPVAPIRIAVGAPDPLGLGVGEHDAPGGGPCSCGAWHGAPVAEPAPLPTGFDALQASTRAVLATMREEGEAAQRFVNGEPAPCEPSAPTDDPGELARLLPGLLDLARARIKALTIPGPPPLNLASESIKLARACELLLGERERLTDERDALRTDLDRLRVERRCDADARVGTLRARVAELEAANARAVSVAESQIVREREGLVDYMHEHHRDAYEAHPGKSTEEIAVEVMKGQAARLATLEATPPPGTVAALLAKVEEARAVNDAALFPERAKGLETAARLITATLGAPTPLDRAVGPADITITITAPAELLASLGVFDALRKAGYEIGACDAPATKEPG